MLYLFIMELVEKVLDVLVNHSMMQNI